MVGQPSETGSGPLVSQPTGSQPTGHQLRGAGAPATGATGTETVDLTEHADLAADPRRWTSHRVLLVVTAVLALAFLVTLALALLSWHAPAMSPIDVPTAPSA